MMERRRSSKKTRSYGETPTSSLPFTTGGRPQYKERVRSAPLGVPQTEEQLQRQHRDPEHTQSGISRRESQFSEPSLSTLSSPTSPTPSQSSFSSQRDCDSRQVPPPTNRHPQGLSPDNDVKTGSFGGVQEVSIAVLGAPAVGKSTFVHCALDLRKASTSPVSSKKVSLEGEISIVRLFELDLEDVEVTAEQRVRWPEKVGGESTPGIDGVLALYDVMDQTSISPMPTLLSELLGFLHSLPQRRATRGLRLNATVVMEENVVLYHICLHSSINRSIVKACFTYRARLRQM